MKKPAQHLRPLNFDQLTISSIEFLLQRQRLEELLYEVCEAVVGIDRNFKITIFNKMAEAMTGIPSEEAVGKDIDDIICLTDGKRNRLDIKKICFGKTLTTIPDLTYSGGQEYTINFKCAVVGPLDNPKECVMTLSDVTREKELEKLKDELFSVASHELKTPITIIKSYLWMLEHQKGGPLNEKQDNYIKKAISATDRILALVNDILSIARLEEGRVDFEIKRVNVSKLLEDLVNDFDSKAQGKGLQIIFENLGEEIYAQADPEQIHEVLINLIENAIKFTKQGSIKITVEKTDDQVKVNIKDTGIGIDKKDLHKLFHKFGRLHYSYQDLAETKGTGLGLYIVKLYMDGMHGEVGVESEGIGLGSTFWFTLPAKPPSSDYLEFRRN